MLFIPLFYLDTLMPYNRTTFQLPPMATTECLCFLMFLLNCHSPKTTFYLTKTQSSTFFNFQTCHSTWALLMAEFETGSHYVVQIDLKLTVKARLASVHNSLLRYWSSSVTDMHNYTQSVNIPHSLAVSLLYRVILVPVFWVSGIPNYYISHISCFLVYDLVVNIWLW